MTEIQLDEFIRTICNQVGRENGIPSFGYPAIPGTQIGGEWEVGWKQKGYEGFAVTMTYWHSSDMHCSEEAFLLWPFPLTQNKREEFINSVTTKIKLLRQRVNRNCE